MQTRPSFTAECAQSRLKAQSLTAVWFVCLCRRVVNYRFDFTPCVGWWSEPRVLLAYMITPRSVPHSLGCEHARESLQRGTLASFLFGVRLCGRAQLWLCHARLYRSQVLRTATTTRLFGECTLAHFSEIRFGLSSQWGQSARPAPPPPPCLAFPDVRACGPSRALSCMHQATAGLWFMRSTLGVRFYITRVKIRVQHTPHRPCNMDHRVLACMHCSCL